MTKWLGILSLSAILMSSCDQNDDQISPIPLYDINEFVARDSTLIYDFLATEPFEYLDSSYIRRFEYVRDFNTGDTIRVNIFDESHVFILDSGTGREASFGDIVSIDYTLYQFNYDSTTESSSIKFDTAIQSTIESVLTIDDTASVSTELHIPIGFDYQADASSLMGSFIPSFSRAVTRIIGLTREGSVSRIIIPSHEGFRNQNRQGVPPNSILVFDIFYRKIHT